MPRKSRDHSEDRRIAAELSSIADRHRSRQLELTCAVYRVPPSGIPELVGSCVLIALADARFLVTAGHVLDRRRSETLIIGVSPEFLDVEGDITRIFQTNTAIGNNDNVDVGVVRLSGRPWCDLPEAQFARCEELDLRPPITARHSYGIVGFPCSINRNAVLGEDLTASAYGIAGIESTAADYAATGYDPEVHLMLGFEKKQVWAATGKRTAPDLYGASGGGMWRYGRSIRHAVGPPLLSAIVTEWHKSGRVQFILGTRIAVITAILASRYPDVADVVRVQIDDPA